MQWVGAYRASLRGGAMGVRVSRDGSFVCLYIRATTVYNSFLCLNIRSECTCFRAIEYYNSRREGVSSTACDIDIVRVASIQSQTLWYEWAGDERRDSSTRDTERNKVAVLHQRIHDGQRVMRLSRPRVRSDQEHSKHNKLYWYDFRVTKYLS